jgi:hypothetical protein
MLPGFAAYTSAPAVQWPARLSNDVVQFGPFDATPTVAPFKRWPALTFFC